MMFDGCFSVVVMCYNASAAPPFYGAPITSVTPSSVFLTSSDGASVAAFSAIPAVVSGPSVFVLPDNRGLSHFYEEFCVRLAEQGHPALAIDYFSRTAGLDYRSRGDDFRRIDNVMGHLGRLTSAELYGDFAAGIAHLPGTVASVGFCLGGRFAFLTAAASFGLSRVVGLYGYPDRIREAPGPLQLASTLTAPILALWGGADEGMPDDVVAAFDAALTAAGNEHEFVTYPGAPHGFFEESLPEFADAQADAWVRILGFLRA
jgi:carboxymethylenebutenolidase